MRIIYTLEILMLYIAKLIIFFNIIDQLAKLVEVSC